MQRPTPQLPEPMQPRGPSSGPIQLADGFTITPSGVLQYGGVPFVAMPSSRPVAPIPPPVEYPEQPIIWPDIPEPTQFNPVVVVPPGITTPPEAPAMIATPTSVALALIWVAISAMLVALARSSVDPIKGK